MSDCLKCLTHSSSGATIFLCENDVYWLVRPEQLIGRVTDYLREAGCSIILGRDRVEAVCGDCVVKAVAKPEDPEDMVKALGTLGREALASGYGAVRLKILMDGGCGRLCEELVMRALMRGGG